MKKPLGRIIYSSTGAVVALAIVFAVNIIASRTRARIDLTENSIYTLSENSRRILGKIDTPVVIRYYFSRGSTAMPQFLRTYAGRVEDLLAEYAKVNRNIKIVKFAPEPDSDAEDSALLDGIQGQMLNSGENIYLGLAISCLDKTATLPFLSPQRENLLEYEITSAISEVITDKKPVIGIMSALPVMGGMPDPMMMQAGQFQPKPKWYFVRQLEKSFELRELPLTSGKIDGDIDTLVLIHPAGITAETEYALDQFVLGGGKLIAFLDPFSLFALETSRHQPQQPHLQPQPPQLHSDLPHLLKAWGISYDAEKILGDSLLGRRHQNRQQNLVTVLDVGKKEMNQDDVVTAQLDQLTFVFGGAFGGYPADGLTKTVLVESSEKSGLLSAQQIQMMMSPENIFRGFSPDANKYGLVAQLSGRFRTAFPDGKPGTSSDDNEDGGTNADSGQLRESARDGVVLLVADSDMLFEEFCFQRQNLFGQQILIPLNDNLNFAQNLVDSVSGDPDMIGIRCRNVEHRPFRRIQEMQAQAEEKFKAEVLELEAKLQATQRHLNELQRRRSDDDQRLVLSPEQQRELERFQRQQAETRQKIKQLRRDLRKDINALENRHKCLNICLMPALVILAGVSIGIYRKRRSEKQ